MTKTYDYRNAYGSVSLTVELPALTGSDKQISWADDLRNGAIEAALDKLIESPRAAKAFAESPNSANLLAALAEEIAGRTEAKTWIDERGAAAGMSLLRAAAAKVKVAK